MNKDTILKAENVSKQYRLGTVGTGTLSHDLNRWWHAVRGKEDPYLKIGEANDRTSKGNSDYVWALQDINFEVKRGEVVGIIGKNGAGKSTLLKILSKVTAPTTGTIKSRGLIASLLEVGTGFNPELTGRENVYLNGAILGMTKAEITLKIDEIVEFSGCERYIDTPVKRYSSGMIVRLAFAVAAHLESDILIVDEVLAVGDSEFQKKCLGKMKDISTNEGRTVLFVSHQLGTISALCTKGVLMDKGRVVMTGSVSEVIEQYTTLVNTKDFSYFSNGAGKDFYVKSCVLKNGMGKYTNELMSDETVEIEIDIQNEQKIKGATLSFTIQSNTGDYLTTFIKNIDELNVLDDKLKVTFKCDVLCPNSYFLRLAIFNSSTNFVYDLQEMICPFKINDNGTDMARFEGVNYGYFNLDYQLI